MPRQHLASCSPAETRWQLPGPFSISITAFGTVPVGGHRGGIIRRSTAKPGDLLFVSGSIGDAWAGLEVQRDEHRAAQWHRCLCTEAMAFLVARSRMPIPRLGLTGPMREFASASLDVSDGLAIDAWRLAKASSVRVEIDTASVPVSPAARSLLERGEIHLHDLITGGDDYEILTTIPADAAEPFKNAAKHANIEVSKIGRVIRGNGLVVLDADGAQMPTKVARLGPRGRTWQLVNAAAPRFCEVFCLCRGLIACLCLATS